MVVSIFSWAWPDESCLHVREAELPTGGSAVRSSEWPWNSVRQSFILSEREPPWGGLKYLVLLVKVKLAPKCLVLKYLVLKYLVRIECLVRIVLATRLAVFPLVELTTIGHYHRDTRATETSEFSSVRSFCCKDEESTSGLAGARGNNKHWKGLCDSRAGVEKPQVATALPRENLRTSEAGCDETDCVGESYDDDKKVG